ncbi:MAG: DUF2384 domain-containing protein [Hoeflea sp.]|uniref:antitoxin Xre/MbcA/ParS-like domain-containing protein n=1 Tax=Hoeflea sp. TaxID=1940281 RepID=UPI001DEA74D3|nr:antitoxin Xre/MbcA/ParS toxin-binding domain-containing protein [Hoeflea sp.]MBU4528929.1 DUF2384 domain-containing protein [Alphaproteobacteria bacterium]MBU4544062.1 DUF2384 domain-containing protein [Alphaproteobacteria bacterium]MBU4551931.1 DUF2384 domain-containing protein [Alphaproteobacteria bacterium]MBV1723396.1 DUF2384 domain-containing protein [Hoeflea sp.]MBV1760375.1 DUF2384 domain-containing protein [Hoeflea sp.]
MDNSNARTRRTDGDSIADRVSAKVSDALKSETTFAHGALLLPAMIAGEVADVVAGLTPEERQRLNLHSTALTKHIRRIVEGYGDRQPDKMPLVVPEAIEPSKGEGLGATLSPAQGDRLLDDIAISRRLEDWSGPVAGATELSREHGIARSSLNRWQHEDDVVGLLKGTRKHVYPVKQFVDGRPVRGLREIIGLAGSHRVAWLWLIQPNPVLGGTRPIDLLRQDRVDEVVETAQAYFRPQ